MTNELIRPIDKETAEAIKEVARLGSKIVDATAGIGRYLDRVLGHVPDDLVGFLGGNWLSEQRIRQADRLHEETEAIRRRRGTTARVDPSPSVAIPLVQAAIDEDREVLRNLWARLLAAAIDPSRTDLVRISLIELVKRMDPTDVRVVERLLGPSLVAPGRDLADALAKELSIDRDEAFLSLERLYELGCLEHAPNQNPYPRVGAKARVLMRAVTD
jgi:hypothetical protein